MSSGIDSGIELVALGRPFQLGMLYDARTDKLIPGITLWDPKILKDNIQSNPSVRQTNYKISTEDTFEKKSEMLNINGELKLSVLCGLVSVSGSAKYINDRKKSGHTERVTLQYSTRTRFDQLTMAHLGRDKMNHLSEINEHIATHVVTGIVYGADAFFLFERSVSDQSDQREIHGAIKAALNKIPKVRVSGSGQLDLTEEEKHVTDKLECQFYGDFNLELNPSTFQEAVMLYKDLPTLLGKENEKAVAKYIYLHPLHLLDNTATKIIRHIDNNLISRSMQLIETLHEFKIRTNDLNNDVSHTITPNQAIHLKRFADLIDDFENSMKIKLSKILPEIRSGICDETKLAALLEQVDRSPFSKRKLEDWLEIKTHENQTLKNFSNICQQGDNVELSKSLLNIQGILDNKFHFCLVIHVIDKNDLFLCEMSKYLEHGIYDQTNAQLSVSHWLNQHGGFEAHQKSTALFLKVAEANKGSKACHFVVGEQFSDKFENEQGISIVSYKNGLPTSLQLTSEPESVCATLLEDQMIRIVWSKPEFGSENVKKYEIYGQKSPNEPWTLLKITSDSTTSIEISKLTGANQFKIRGVVCYGYTPDSDVSNTINVEIPTAAPFLQEQDATASIGAEQSSNNTEREEFAAPGKYKKLDCSGRQCARCGQCRDWYYTGDWESWEWIRNWENWNNRDWNIWYKGDFHKHFKKRRDGAKCDRGSGTAGLIRFGTYAFSFFSNGFRDSFLRYAAPCLCADNIID